MSILHELTTDGDVEGLENTLLTTSLCINDTDIECCGKTPLHWACYLGRLECVNILISYGANVTSRMSDGKVPAHCAAETGQIECLQALIDAGCSVRVTDKFNDTPKRVAEIYGQKECYELLQRTEDKEIETELANHPEMVKDNSTQCIMGENINNACPEIMQDPVSNTMATNKRKHNSRS